MNINGEILNRVFDNGKYTGDQRKSTLDNALRIFDKMPNSKNGKDSNVGLVVGRVQSGKTANVITLSGLALDNDYKVIILFLSDTNNLLTQNTDRFIKNFENIEDVLVVKKSKDGDFDNLLSAQALDCIYGEDQKIIICSLKHSKHITEIKNILSQSPYRTERTLIIDDEGDDIGLNTAKFNEKFIVSDGNDSIVEKERTATNKSIIELKESLTKVAYISLTATPEANILLQNFQQLAPDYCVTLEPNKGYTGLLTFHGPESDKVVEINDKDEMLDLNGLPSSFENALVFFLAGCVVRNFRHGKKIKHSMMVHPCHKMDNHVIVYEKIEAYFSQIKYNLSHNNQSGQMFAGKVMNQVNLFNQHINVTVQDVYETLKKTQLHLVNSREQCNDLHSKMKLLPYHIVIGGNMLDRGITIDGLAVTYMIRMARVGQADTLLQRARWFGYKESYIDLCRVYMPVELKRQFEKLIELEDSVWDFLYMCDKNNLIPKNIDANILTPEGMKAVAANKASIVTSSLPSSTRVQSEIVHNSDRNNENVQLVNSTIDWSGAIIETYTSSQIHRRITVSVSDFEVYFSKFHFSQLDKSLNMSVIKTVISQGRFDDVDIWDMRYTKGETRSTDEYHVLSLLQGYSESKKPGDPDYYIGDRNLRTNNLSVQIHHVKLKNDIGSDYKTGDEVIILALILPEGYVSKGSVTRRMSEDEIFDKLK
jgi:hypothetical protein